MDVSRSLVVRLLADPLKSMLQALYDSMSIDLKPFPSDLSHIVRQEIPVHIRQEGNFNLINCTVPFNRAPCIQSGVDLLENEDTFFICDVDLLVKIDTLQRIRLHVDNGKVYFPVFFSQYKIATSEIAETNGFWRTFSYGMLAMKKVIFSSSR